MKKLFAMLLALAMLLSMSAALADDDDVITIKVAHIGPDTGDVAIYGKATYRGGLIAVEEINAAGGKYRIDYFYEDDKGEMEEAINAFNDAFDNGAQIILGTTTSKPCEAASMESYDSDDKRTFFLTPSASSPAVIADRDNVYQVCFTDDNQGLSSALYIADRQLGSKIAVLYNNADVYSKGIYETFEAEAATLGLNIVYRGTFNDDTTDYSQLVRDARNFEADLVFLPIYYTPASAILTAASQIDYKPIFFGVDGMDGILTVPGFDPALAEGVLLLTPFVANAEDDATVSFVTKYVDAYGEKPNQFAADAYDGIYIIAAAAELAGITADMSNDEICDAMIAAMQELNYSGLTGDMKWNADGTVTKIPLAMEIVNGDYELFVK